MTVYKITLQTLSPVHIGDGVELRKDFEIAVHQGYTYRLDEDAILEAKAERLENLGAGRYPPPAKLLAEADFANRRLFRYRLKGMPVSMKTFASVRSCMKDHQDRPYVPGSTLKGALRTALAWTGWTEVKPRLDRTAIGNRRSWAAQPLESKLFGPDPNHDLLRALHVSDCFGPRSPGQGLALVNAQVLTRHAPGSPIELEALVGDVTFNGTLTIDDTLFSTWAEKELHFANRRRWLDELTQRAQAHSRARILRLATWFEKAEAGTRIADFYRQLSGIQLPPNQALLQIGWGAGWDGKTFGSHLEANAQLLDRLISEFKMQRRPPKAPPRRPGSPFPSSRRVAVNVKDGAPLPVAPFGWVLFILEKSA